jgi:hypothetical protein
MGASTGKLCNMIGIPKPIMKYHALDKICMLISILGYTILQLIMGILGRFAEKKNSITLFFILTTWVLLCDGQRRDDAAIPFQSFAGCGNTVLGITRRDGGPECHSLTGLYRPECPSLTGLYRPECPLSERNLLCRDGLYLGSSHFIFRVGLPHSCFLSSSTCGLTESLKMSSGGEDSRNDAVTVTDTGRPFVRSSVKSVIKALSGSRFATPIVEVYDGAEKTDRDFERHSISDRSSPLLPSLGELELYVSQRRDSEIRRNAQDTLLETGVFPQREPVIRDEEPTTPCSESEGIVAKGLK